MEFHKDNGNNNSQTTFQQSRKCSLSYPKVHYTPNLPPLFENILSEFPSLLHRNTVCTVLEPLSPGQSNQAGLRTSFQEISLWL